MGTWLDESGSAPIMAMAVTKPNNFMNAFSVLSG
jgi:hypothetical protein